MSFQKAIHLAALVLGVGLLGLEGARANPMTDFQALADADCKSISDYVNGQFGRSLGFYTSLGWNTPPSVFDFVKGPHFEVGLGAGADVMTFPNLNSLILGALNLNANLNFPAIVPVPFPVATLKVGLFNGLDAGLKVNYLPQVSVPEVGLSANYLGWGLDLRYKILDGPLVPNITACASFDTMNGSFSVNTNVNQTTTYYDSNNSTSYPNTTLQGNSTYTLNWNTRSLGLKVEVGKDLGLIYPFGAIGVQRNSGDVSSTMAVSGTVNVPGQGSGTVGTSSLSDTQPVIFEPKYVLGFDLGEGFHWAVVAESNGTDVAGSTSFRLQF